MIDLQVNCSVRKYEGYLTIWQGRR